MALRLAARSVVPAVRRPLSRAFAGDVEKYGHIPTDVEQQAGRRKIELENEMKGEVRPAGIPEPAREGGGAKGARSRLARVAPYRGGRPREWAPHPRGSPASRSSSVYLTRVTSGPARARQVTFNRDPIVPPKDQGTKANPILVSARDTSLKPRLVRSRA